MKLHDAVLWWPTFWMQIIQGVLIPRTLSRTNSELSYDEAVKRYVDAVSAYKAGQMAAAAMSAINLSAHDNKAPQ